MITGLTIAILFLFVCGYLMATAINNLQDEIQELKKKMEGNK